MTEPLERLRAALADRYTIEREIGSGGMATVFLAEDLKHRRQVALKVLKPELAAILGADRFLKEIEVTANLQHPNILPLYDSGEADGFLYYVMPYVEGESLRELIDRKKQLGVDEAVGIVRSVAAALDFAHRRDVIHRDIKPANILLHEGQALVADFGIALAVSEAGGARLTETGLSVGTPHYMSPEQASGDREIDRRSDVYSLGAVAYETLVGDPPHPGSTAQAVFARVLSETPAPIRRTRESVPANVDGAVRKALARSPADRFETTAEFAAAIEDPSFHLAELEVEVGTAAAARSGPGWQWVATALLVLLAIIAMRGWLTPDEEASPPRTVSRVMVPLPEGHMLAIAGSRSYPFALSRDGSRLVYLAQEGPDTRLYVRYMDDPRAHALQGTEGARQPFFSPDGEWVGFFADGSLQKVPVAGGAPLIVTEAAAEPFGASWGTDGTILYAVSGSGLFSVPDAGGASRSIEITEVSPTDSAQRTSDLRSTGLVAGSTPRWPHHLPGDADALITTDSGLGVLDLSTGQLRYALSGSQGRYLPTGHLMYHEGQERIRVVPFDIERLEVTGPPSPALEAVFRGPGAGAVNYAVSETGTLVYVAGGFERTLVLVDGIGREAPLAIEPRGYRFPRVSPDGSRLAVTVDPRPSDIWIVDLVRSTAQAMTTEHHNLFAAWAPDGDRIVFSSDGGLKTMQLWAGGDARIVKERSSTESPFYAYSWLPGDRLLVVQSNPTTQRDLFSIDMNDGTVVPILASPASERLAGLSPDRKWMAYQSDVSGAEEVYVRPFPGPGSGRLVSVGGGGDANWSADGTELYYRVGNTIMAVDVRTEPDFLAGPPRTLFSGPYDFTQTGNWDVLPDGRFVMVKADPTTSRQFQVVFNWFSELQTESKEGGD